MAAAAHYCFVNTPSGAPHPSLLALHCAAPHATPTLWAAQPAPLPAALDPDDEPDAAAGSAKAHSRGMAPGVFVPWAHVNSSPLNLPQHQMDFYVPG